jgi:hypothetical protein
MVITKSPEACWKPQKMVLRRVLLKDATKIVKYSGSISLYVNDRLAGKLELDDDVFTYNFKNKDLNILGNKIEITFQHPVGLKYIHFADLQNEYASFACPVKFSCLKKGQNKSQLKS